MFLSLNILLRTLRWYFLMWNVHTCVSIVGDVDVVNGVVEAYEDEVRQRNLLHSEYVDVDRTLMLTSALSVSLAPIFWT